MLCIFGGLGWYCYQNGIVYSFMNEGKPEPGRACEVVGPIGEGVYAAPAKSDMQYVIDSHIGTVAEKAQGRMRVGGLVRNGALILLDDHTPVKIVSNSTLRVLGFGYPLTGVEVTGGPQAGLAAWIQREDLVDTPLQQIYQSMRVTRVNRASD